MSINRTIIIIVALALITLVSCQKNEQISADQVTQAISEAERNLDWLSHRLAGEQFEQLTEGQSDSLAFFKALARDYYANNSALELLEGGRRLVKNDEVALRKLDLLKVRLARGRAEAVPSIAHLRDSLVRIAFVSPDAVRADRSLSFDPDRTRREIAFRAANDGTEAEGLALARLIRIRNQEARRKGYNDYYTMLFDADGFSLDDFKALLIALEQETRPGWEAILTRLGRNGTEYWDIAFGLSQPLASLADSPPVDSQFKLAFLSFDELGFDLYDLPIYTYLTLAPDKPTNLQTFRVRPRVDLRLAGNLQHGLGSAGKLAGELGGLIHSARIAEKSPLFSNQISEAWGSAFKSFFAQMTTDSEWLARYRQLTPEIAQQIQQANNDLRMVALRQLLLDLTFEQEAYRSKNNNLGQLYWDLAERIMHLPRHDDLYPWADDIELIARPVTRHNRLLGEVIAAQTRAYLQRVNGSIVANQETKAFLVQNYLRFGSRYPWPELLQRGTGEKLTLAYLAESLVSDH